MTTSLVDVLAAISGQGAPAASALAGSAARPLRAWMENPDLLRQPRSVLPYLAVEGRTTLFSGREKIGKTTLAAGAVAAASRGEQVLGTPLAEPLTTLWYSIDEPVGDTVRRFAALGADPERIIINAAPRTEAELRAALAMDLAAHPTVQLIVLDTLSRVIAASNLDANSAKDVAPFLARLVDDLHQSGRAAILIYHTGKGGREYRGSTAFGATVDEILTLRRRGEQEDDFDDDAADDGRRLLVQDGRNLRGRVHLQWHEGGYTIHDDTTGARDRLLDASALHGRVATRAALAKMAGLRKASGLKVIAELIRDGSLTEDGHGLTAGSRVREPARYPEPTREPARFPGSHRFPERGTEREPNREPQLGLGSRSCNPTLQKREPEPERQSATQTDSDSASVRGSPAPLVRLEWGPDGRVKSQ